MSLHGPEGGGDILVEADRQRLLQVLLNLVSNAIKYNHDGGRVELSVDETDDRVRLIVHDTGPGLTEEQIERVFVPFDRLGLEHSGIEGTGVGLSLSRGLAERMGGSLTVRSTVGVGSDFCVDLPATGASPALPIPDPRTGAVAVADQAIPSHPSLTGGRS